MYMADIKGLEDMARLDKGCHSRWAITTRLRISIEASAVERL